MTVTEAPPSTPAESAPARPAATRGLAAVLGTGDHRGVGRMWIGGAALFLVVTVVVGSLLGFERISVDEFEVLGNDHILQFFTLYRVALTFLVVLPLFLGLAIAVVPMQVGAQSLAFPRAAAAALWAWFGGGVLLLVSYAIDGGPGGKDADAVDLWIVAFGLIVVALVLASVCVATTVIALRTPEMRLDQVPPFSWSMLVAGTVWALSLPVLVAGIVLAYLDHRYGQVLFGAPGDLFPRLEWAFDQPQVYAMAIPVLGIFAEMVPVASGAVQRFRGALFAGIAGFGILAFGAWAQPFYRPKILEEAMYIGVAFAILLPVVVVLLTVADTGARGKPRVLGPLLPATLAVLVLLAGVTGGAVGVIDTFNLLGTTWQTGVMNAVFGASLLAVLAGLLWWAPKLYGRTLPASLGALAALALLVGTLVLAVCEGIAGLYDEPAFPFVAEYQARGGIDTLNTIAAVGSVVLGLGALLVTLLVLRGAAGSGDGDGEGDPWGGQTLEWHDGPVPVVTSATPLVGAGDGEGEA